MGDWLRLIAPTKSPHVADDARKWFAEMECKLPSRDFKYLSWWVQACYDAGIINDYQRYCLNYYGTE